jgi:osmoprotectant transport system substrate-binding protein
MIRTTRSRLLLLLAALSLIAAACDGGGGDDAAGDGDGGEERGSVIVGSTNFAEQEIVASMYAAVLREAGYDVEERFQLGSREVVLPALQNGDIDLYPEYVGTALEFLGGGAGEATSDTDETTELLRERFAEDGISVLTPAEAQDKNALVVTPETADELGLAAVSDLSDVAGELTLGGPPECPQRPLCIPGYEEVYGLEFGEFVSLDAGGPLTTAALANGDIDVALMFSTQGVIAERGWIMLEDDGGLQPAENVVADDRDDALTDEVRELLDAIAATLTTEDLTELNRRVDVDGEDPSAVAEDYLRTEGLLEG